MKKKRRTVYFYFGFLGFFGLLGFTQAPIFLLNFALFACFANFWWNKLGDEEDERLIKNRLKAANLSFKICFSFLFLLSLGVGQLNLSSTYLYRLELLFIALSFAIAVNLWAYLTYYFDLKG